MEPRISTFIETLIALTSTRLLIAAAIVLLGTQLIAAIRRRRAANPDQAAAVFQALDIAAFRNLVDSSEEVFLRQNLPPRAFRAIKRQRVKAALLYTWDVGRAARALAVVGQAARRSSDPAVAESGIWLLQSALQLRLQAAHGFLVLAGEYLWPDRGGDLSRLLDQHQRSLEALLRLGQFPAAARAAHPGGS